MIDKIVNILEAICPLSEKFQALGLSKEASDPLALFVWAVFLCITGWLFIRFRKRYLQYKSAKKNILNYFGDKYNAYCKLFVESRYQKRSPTHSDEPSSQESEPLILHMIKNVFRGDQSVDRFFLILGDSGMGKTTFLVNLYMRYYSIWNFHRKYTVKFIPFVRVNEIKELINVSTEDAKNTILLLDALDEYNDLHISFGKNVLSNDEFAQLMIEKCDKLMEPLSEFHKVIITCRTQYFPQQEEKPYVLEIRKPGGNGFHTMNKLYLSPFHKSDVEYFLKKKYLWDRKARLQAAKIVSNSPCLMMRPLLLSYIDYFLEAGNKSYFTTFEIYETLVNKWIEREANNCRRKPEDCSLFQEDLFVFSREVALSIYEQMCSEKITEDSLSLSKIKIQTILDHYYGRLESYEATGQSLLTPDILHDNWKFAHKSILEFFIACESFQNRNFFDEIDFAGLDMAKRFFKENLPPFLREEMIMIGKGILKIGTEKDQKNGHSVKVSNFLVGKYPVTNAQYEKYDKNHKRCRESDSDDQPVVHVSWEDAKKYCEWLTKEMNCDFEFSLPSQAQWEYAARAGATTDYCFGNDENQLKDYAWYSANSRGRTHPVGMKKPNHWGLYDMHGNVWEWCEDLSEKTPDRVMRGGGWDNFEQLCRVAYRYDFLPGFRDGDLGFRLAAVLKNPLERSGD